jgi:superfamily II DNA or RNA helicase
MKKFSLVPISTGALAKVPFCAYTREALRFLDSAGVQVDMAEVSQDGKTMLAPRNLFVQGDKDLTSLGFTIPGVHSSAQPPRSEEQKLLIEASVAAHLKNEDHIIEAPTGFGKTYVGAMVAQKLQRTTLIVVPKQDLIDSWFKTLRDLLGIPVDKIGYIQQDKCDFEEKWFVIGMLHSLVIPGRYDDYPMLRGYFGTVLFDEVHRLGADGFSTICHMFPARHRLGLSATPKRWDGKERLFEAHLGPVMFRGSSVPMSPKVLVKSTGWKIPKGWVMEDGKWTKGNMKVAPGRMMPITKKLAASAERNSIIAEFVKLAYSRGRRVVVMSDLIEDHLQPLFHTFAEEGIPGNDMDFYVGGRKKAELEIAKTKPVVLATYQMCAEGTDVPEWDTLVMATPRSNVKQAIGRVMRFKEGKPQPVVLDLVDSDSIFHRFYNKREKQYYEVEADIVRMKSP